ncbi:MAG: hypothetical protein AAF322_10405 [Pseudomonadota bacterium]
MRGALAALGLCLLVASGALAAAFGVEDDELAEALRAEAEAIASGPVSIERTAAQPNAEARRLLDAEPLLQEAYRTDPEATLDLIRRIIDAAK